MSLNFVNGPLTPIASWALASKITLRTYLGQLNSTDNSMDEKSAADLARIDAIRKVLLKNDLDSMLCSDDYFATSCLKEYYNWRDCAIQIGENAYFAVLKGGLPTPLFK